MLRLAPIANAFPLELSPSVVFLPSSPAKMIKQLKTQPGAGKGQSIALHASPWKLDILAALNHRFSSSPARILRCIC